MRAPLRIAIPACALALLLPGIASADPARIVLGTSLGAVRIGASERDVTAAYGKPASLSHGSYGGRPFDLALYAEHGGRLQVFYDRFSRRVVGVSTTSPYYRTAGGVGVGVAGTVLGRSGFRWNAACTVSYHRLTAGLDVEVLTRGHTRAGAITSLSMLDVHYVGDC